MFGRFVQGARALRAAFIVVLVAATAFAARDAHADAVEAKKIFTTRCMACHTFGKGVKVGPDLKGVNERRQRAWLLKFVRSSSVVIASGDPTAVDLFQQFKQQRMPDWSDLSEDQVTSILDWLGINGPEQREIDERLAESATLAEIENGRQLFLGQHALANGGTACGACHSVREDGSAAGGSLGTDLTDIYADFQDGEMTQFLRHPCFERMPESTNAAFLTPAETFYLKGYLRHAVVAERGVSGPAGGADKGSDKAPAPASLVAKPIDGAGPSNPSSGTPGAVPAQPPAPDSTKRVPWTPKAADITAARHSYGRRIEGTLLFLAFPYISLLILIAGIAIRYVMARRAGGKGAQASIAWKLFSGGIAWKAGLAITALLHIVGIVIPSDILAWNGTPIRLYLLEGSAFLFGAIALIGWIQIMRHHFRRTVKSTRASMAEIVDTVLLSVLCLAVVSGLVVAVMYRWGSSWAAGTLSPYMTSLLRGAPAPDLVEELPFLVRLHVLSWFVLLALVPFTSLALVLTSAIHRGLLVIARPFDAMGAAGQRAAGKLSPARWLWPEEDAIDLGKSDNAQEPS